MPEPRKTEHGNGEKVGEQETAPQASEVKRTGKTMQELERLQFDALERFER